MAATPLLEPELNGDATASGVASRRRMRASLFSAASLLAIAIGAVALSRSSSSTVATHDSSEPPASFAAVGDGGGDDSKKQKKKTHSADAADDDDSASGPEIDDDKTYIVDDNIYNNGTIPAGCAWRDFTCAPGNTVSADSFCTHKCASGDATFHFCGVYTTNSCGKVGSNSSSKILKPPEIC